MCASLCARVLVGGSELGRKTLQIAQVSDTVCENNVFLSLRTSDVCLTYYF